MAVQEAGLQQRLVSSRTQESLDARVTISHLHAGQLQSNLGWLPEEADAAKFDVTRHSKQDVRQSSGILSHEESDSPSEA